jgi:hypothetical protein
MRLDIEAWRTGLMRTWTRIDEGLPDNVDLNAVHGFEASDLYAVGLLGDLWHYDGDTWTRRELPTNRTLSTIKCTEDGNVYIAGHGGTLIRGRGEAWEIVGQQQTKDDIWDLEWFDGKLYVSTMRNVYRLKTNELEAVDFGGDPPKSCYQLSSAKGVMWSNGEYDILSFDGQQWTRVV